MKTHERTSTLRLRLVGEFAVYQDGSWQPPEEVGSRKSRLLLALLAVERGHLIEMDRIIDVLWQHEPPQRPADNVATLVSRLRATFGGDAIAGRRSGYRLGGLVRVDLDEAAMMLGTAESRMANHMPGAASDLAQQALESLSGGAALTDHPGASWADPARLSQGKLLRRARHLAATAALRTGQPGLAGIIAEAAIAADPFDETAYRALMAAHDTAGETAQALLVYQRLRATLAGELGIDPAPATRDLHVAILRRNVPAMA